MFNRYFRRVAAGIIACAVIMSGAGAVYGEDATDSSVVSEASSSEESISSEPEAVEPEVTPTAEPEATPAPEPASEVESAPSSSTSTSEITVPTEAPAAPTESATETPAENPAQQPRTADQEPMQAGEEEGSENPDPEETPAPSPSAEARKASSFTLTIDYKSGSDTVIPEPEPLVYVYLEEKSEGEGEQEPSHHFAKAAFDVKSGKSTASIPFLFTGDYTMKLYTADDRSAADAACTDNAVPSESIFKEIDSAGHIGAFRLQMKPESVGILETPNSLDLHAVAEGLEFRPGGTKKISGRTSTNKVFTFELYRADDKYTKGEKLYEAKTDGTITSANGLAYAFGKIGFTKAGDYHYVVKEKTDDAKEGFTFDTTEYHIAVKAAAQGSSLCVSEFTVSKGAAIEGAFSFSTLSGPAFKVTGNRMADSLKGETYELYGPLAKRDDLVDSKTGELKSTAGTPASGKVEEVSKVNTFSVQKNYTANGSTVYFALVKKGNKVPETVIELATGSAGDPASATWNLTGCGCDFTNKYKAASIKEAVKVNKVVKGNPDKAETFKFVMKRTSGKKVSEMSIKGSGEGTFPKQLTFSKTGTYTYVITETAGSNANMTYDKSSFKVVFKVTDDGKGNLVAKRTITKGSKSASSVKFTNTYTEPEPTVYGDFSLTKVDSSNTSQAVEGAVYTLYGPKGKEGSAARKKAEKNLKAGKIVDSEVKKLTSDSTGSDGVVTFTDLEAGTYYVIRETSAPNGYQRSANPIIISTKAKNGQFSATVIDSGEGTVTKDANSGEIIWKEHPVRVVIYMKSSSGALLTNAKLELVDTVTGKTVDSWKSGKTGHEVKYLVAGRRYTIKQTNKLAGYEQAKSVTFTATKTDVETSDVIQQVTVTSKKVTSSSRTTSTTRRTNGTSGSRGNTTRGNTTSRKTKTANTGDNAPIAALIALMAAALAAVVLVLRRKKK